MATPAAAKETPKQSINELEKLIEATLAQYRSSFDAASSIASCDQDKSTNEAISSDAYYSRLNTFRTETYFAKPLCLSPLNCAAFGWQNTEHDIIQCPQCNAAICVAFHPNLNTVSYDQLTQQYLQMLATSHEENCVFGKYALRWLKIMERLDKERKENESDKETNRTADVQDNNVGLSKKQPIYVPPYLLTLSKQLLVFEDASKDGSVTYHNIQEDSSAILNDLPKCQYEMHVPDAVKEFCNVHPRAKYNMRQAANLLATFGWSIDQNDEGCVQCKLCFSKSLLPTKKRPRDETKVEYEIQEVKLHLINSHRVYCPFVSGFSFGTSHKSEAGWKVVLRNLIKYAKKENSVEEGTVKLDDLWREGGMD